MKLTPKKRQAKSIKTRLIWSFAANLVIIFVVFVAFGSIRNITQNAEALVSELNELSDKIQKIKTTRQSFLLTETINPSFYESKNNHFIIKHNLLLEEINLQIEGFYINSYVQNANVIPSLRSLQNTLSLYHISFDSLINVQLQRGFKSYGVEGDMRRAIYSVMNSGYTLDQVKILSLRRHEKDYILRKDLQYLAKLTSVITLLKDDIDKDISEKYGRVYLKGGLDTYLKNFKELVKLDRKLGYYGVRGIKDNLNSELSVAERQIAAVIKTMITYMDFWKKINLSVLFISAFSIILVNAGLLFYLLSRLGKPINKLSKSIHEIVAKDFQGELYTIKTKDEIGDLSNDFNYVLEKMNERSDEIIQQKEELAITYEKIDTIRQIGGRLNRHVSVEAIVKEFYHSLGNILDFSTFLIGIYQNDELNYQGYNNEGEFISFDRSIHEFTHLGVECFRRQEPIIVKDFLGDDNNEFKHLLPVITSQKIGSLIYLPMTSASGRVGVLALHNTTANSISDVQINMLGSIVVYAVSALDTAINYESLEHQVEKKTAKINSQKEELVQSNSLLKGTLDELEFTNKQWKSSVQYAQRIQQALLPNFSEVRSKFEDAFILYRPKDIVSGDFYWLETKGDFIYFAVADCTGHGVPGAFMSILGREILSNLVNTKDITSPAELLDELHIRIRVVLQQERLKNKDGMDIGLCVMNKRTNEFRFAGAHHPLYIVKKNDDGENFIEVIDGDRQSIGGHVLKKKKYAPFSEHCIKRSRNEEILSLYMCSDGYQDQFGGDQGRKFYKKNFRNMLKDIADKPMYEQKSIIAMTIDDWMTGTVKQTDDILVVGFQPKMDQANNMKIENIKKFMEIC
ncbi:HAMP domain-containing protein [Flammeovirga pectinis]|uniref:HAMP domain-containing protein n=1 Tax=Flammeovirga pectinis TaxID=2494373 RepID=A0A3Q9FKA2_9BACT|nr:SpoIIE family protein phosphatase [Flammeovirga pectinis]AZQ61641.1 HAMP domain-containing protein [Flammeovirga pectinis]